MAAPWLAPGRFDRLQESKKARKQESKKARKQESKKALRIRFGLGSYPIAGSCLFGRRPGIFQWDTDNSTVAPPCTARSRSGTRERIRICFRIRQDSGMGRRPNGTNPAVCAVPAADSVTVRVHSAGPRRFLRLDLPMRKAQHPVYSVQLKDPLVPALAVAQVRRPTASSLQCPVEKPSITGSLEGHEATLHRFGGGSQFEVANAGRAPAFQT